MFRFLMNNIEAVVVLFTTSLLVACGCGGAPHADPDQLPHPMEADPSHSQPAAPPTGPRADIPDGVVAANNRFAMELFRRLAEENGNFAYSPASISSALAMTYAGARGENAREMAAALELADLSADEVHRGFGDQLANWNRDHQGAYELNVANRAYFDRGVPVHAEYESLLRDSYRAPLELMDFQGAAEPARVAINSWVESQTRDRIRDLLPPGGVGTSTRLVLVNAVYFKGSWLHAFESHATRPRTFTPHRSEAAPVPTMFQNGTFAYAHTDGVHVLRLPYEGEDFEMVVILPEDQRGLPDVQARLTAATVDAWIAATRERDLDVYLPKFTYDPSAPTPLGETLQSMGMRLAFNGGDFSGISDEPLQISEVFHKAFVEVNEVGTEAAAATAVVMETGAAASQTPEFRADHPFIYLIRDRHSGGWLFAGRVQDPR